MFRKLLHWKSLKYHRWHILHCFSFNQFVCPAAHCNRDYTSARYTSVDSSALRVIQERPGPVCYLWQTLQLCTLLRCWPVCILLCAGEAGTSLQSVTETIAVRTIAMLTCLYLALCRRDWDQPARHMTVTTAVHIIAMLTCLHFVLCKRGLHSIADSTLVLITVRMTCAHFAMCTRD